MLLVSMVWNILQAVLLPIITLSANATSATKIWAIAIQSCASSPSPEGINQCCSSMHCCGKPVPILRHHHDATLEKEPSEEGQNALWWHMPHEP